MPSSPTPHLCCSFRLLCPRHLAFYFCIYVIFFLSIFAFFAHTSYYLIFFLIFFFSSMLRILSAFVARRPVTFLSFYLCSRDTHIFIRVTCIGVARSLSLADRLNLIDSGPQSLPINSSADARNDRDIGGRGRLWRKVLIRRKTHI